MRGWASSPLFTSTLLLPAASYLLGAEVAGLLWYLLYLRPRIANRSAGVYRTELANAEKPEEASTVTG